MNTSTVPPGDSAGKKPRACNRAKPRRGSRKDGAATREQAPQVPYERRQRRSKAYYEQLLEALPAGVYTCDARGRLLLYNRNAVALWGRKPDEDSIFWCGSLLMRRPDGSELPHEDCPIAQAVHGRQPAQGEVIVERPDGSRIAVQASATPMFDADGNLTGAVSFVLDRTAQSRAEEAQAHLAALVDSSDDAIVSQTLDGVIRTWNGGAERIFGYRAEEMIGQPIAGIIPPELHEEEEQRLAGISRGERVEQFETVRVARDGRRIDVSLRVSPIHNTLGQVIGASKIVRDVTRSKRIAGELAEADRRKDQFLAMLAHELRNPLAAIATGIELLGMPDDARHLESTRRMLDRQTRHLAHLVDDLMDIARISRGAFALRRETLDARDAVERAIETVRASIDAQRHRLRIANDAQPLWLHADPMRLEQLVLNLLTNAVKFTNPGGLIEIGARNVDGAGLIFVRDDGIGIAPELLPCIFDTFAQSAQSADRSAGGLGIGLTLVKSIAELHGGTVEARSGGTGRGAEFRVTLPLAAPPQAAERSRGTQSGARHGKSPARRVLVVDDNKDAAVGLARLLEFSGHTVELAHTGPAALQANAEFRPEAVLLDIGLPGIDGYEVARRLRATPAHGDVLLIAFSGYYGDEDRRRSREAGFDHHVAKPAELRELLRLLHRRPAGIPGNDASR